MEDQRGTGPYLAAAIAAAAAIGLALWRLSPASPGEPAPRSHEAATAQPTVETPAEPATPANSLPLEPPAASYRIAEHGRIAISSESFEAGVPVALDLALTDVRRGSEPRSVRIASVDGRQTRATATALPGAGTGIRLELDPAWLKPGKYLVEVTTAEKVALPMRRYVLEVR